MMRSFFADASGWIDLSPKHKEVRERLERLIKEYKENTPHLPEVREWRMPVLVAPYGSGKSTLMRYLVRYCWTKLEIPALKVNLSLITTYIESHLRQSGGGKVHADELPKIIEEFFEQQLIKFREAIETGASAPRELLDLPHDKDVEEYLLPRGKLLDTIKKFGQEGGIVGVLLIDEIEEARRMLDRYVEYETTPFRGLADNVVHHTLRVFPILALGPTTALRELTMGPGGWRVELIEIPIVGKSYAQALLSKKLGGGEETELLANAAWWMAKGRVGWLYKVINDILPNIAGVLDDPSRLEEELIRPGTALDEEVIQGVSLMDRTFLRGLLGEHRGSERYLLLLSALFVGPIPKRLLEKLGLKDVDVHHLPRKRWVVGRYIVSIEEVERAFKEVLHGKLEGRELSDALWIIGEVLRAWSFNGYLIFDIEALRELVKIASDHAYEFSPLVGREIEVVRVEALSIQYVPAEEVYVALHPALIPYIYPPLILWPVIGLARQVSNTDELHNYIQRLSSNEIRRVSECILLEVLGFDKKVFGEKMPLLLPVSSKMSLKMLEQLFFECLLEMDRGQPILFVLIGRYDENEKLRELLQNTYELLFRTVASALSLGERESLYMLSLIYDILEGQSFEKLPPTERRVYEWFNNILKFLIVREYYDLLNKYELRTSRCYSSLKEAREEIEALRESRGRQVGSGQALVFYLNAAFPQNIDRLINVAQGLSSMREELEVLLRELQINLNEDFDESKVLENIFEGIGLLTRKPAISFLERVKELKVLNNIGSNQLDFLARLLSNYIKNRMDVNSFQEAMAKMHEKIGWLVGDADPELTYTLLSGVLAELEHIYDPIITFYSAIKIKLIDLTRIFHQLIDLKDKISKMVKELNDEYGIDISKRFIIQGLLKSLESSAEKLNELIKYCETPDATSNNLNISSTLLRIALFEELRRFKGQGSVSEGVLKTFSNNLQQHLLKYLTKLSNMIDEIEGRLREMKEELSIEILEKEEELIKAIKSDLEEASKPPRSLAYLSDALEELTKRVRKISKQYEEYEEHIEELRRNAEDLINRLSSLAGEVKVDGGY